MSALIVQVRTRRLSLPLRAPFVTALRRTTTVETLLCEVVADDGRVGYGEAPQVWQVTGESVAGAEACVQGPLTQAVIGRPADPTSAPYLASAVAGNAGAKAALDVALHDLAAARAGVPLARYLGAHGDLSLRTDATIALSSPDRMVETALAAALAGFGVLKLKVGADPALDVERVLAVRVAVGPDVGLRLDANQGWDAVTAVRTIRELEDAGVDLELVEQPVPARDVLGLAHVTAHVSTPVLADEAVFTLEDLVDVVRHRAADAVNLKLAKCGGLGPALELARLARAAGMEVLVGSMMESHVGVGAAAALALAVGAERVADLDAAWWLDGSPYRGGPRYDGDRLVLPDEPGLGIRGVRGGVE